MTEPGPIEQAINDDAREGVFTRRQYMVRKLLLQGAQFYTAVEAVTSTAMSHRDWNMDEQRTWEEWETALAEGRKGSE